MYLNITDITPLVVPGHRAMKQWYMCSAGPGVTGDICLGGVMSRRPVMSQTGFHGACRVLVSTRVRSMCGELVLFWVLTRPDVFCNCTHNENTYTVYY